MKISAVQLQNYNPYLFPKSKKKDNRETEKTQTFGVYYPANITFGLANAEKLKLLFRYDVPCMYSGVIMIDPKRVQKLIKAGVFNLPAVKAVEYLKPFEKSIVGVERKVYDIIKEESKNYPELNAQNLLKKISPKYEETLRYKQEPVFQELINESQTLPEKYKHKFDELMQKTYDKINGKPVEVGFSSNEFIYKMLKIKREYETTKNVKLRRLVSKLFQESKNLKPETNNETIEYQKGVINFLQVILKTSALKNNEQLNEIISTANKKLNKEKILIKFSKKNFIYDLAKIFEDDKNEKLKEKFIEIARKLPTSQDNIDAYIIKFSNEESEKILYRLLSPSLASIEHILPRSCGGENVMSNYGGACSRQNSERQSIDFVEQMKRNPKTAENCQKYVDRLIELVKNGTFEKLKVNTGYIKDFKRIIEKQSDGKIVLDISKL